MQKIYTLFASFLYFVCNLCAQDVAVGFEHFTTKNGLFDNQITASVQDKFGFLWFASKHGLMRYNGYEFSIYQPINGDTNSLSNNHVRSLLVTSDGRLVVGTSRGLNVFQHSDNSFTRLLYTASRYSSAAANVSALAEDLHGAIWVGTSNQQGLYCIKKQDGIIKNWRNRVPSDKVLLSNTVLSLCCDYYGVVWIGTDAGLMSYDPQNNMWHQYASKMLINSSMMPSDAITSLFVDEQNIVWIGTGLGLFSYDQKLKVFKKFEYALQPNVAINQISSISDNTLAVATAGAGLLFFNTITQKWWSLQHNPLNSSSLSANSIQTFLHDKEGNWWVAAGTYGLDVRFNQKTALNSYVSNPKNPQSLSFSSVTTVYEDSYRRIWVGTDGGGLNLFDAKLETFKHYVNNPQNVQSLSSNSISCIAEDAKSNLLVGTAGGGFHIFYSSKGVFQRFQHNAANANSLANNNVSDIFVDSTGVLWIATLGGGVDAYNLYNQTFIHHQVRYGQANSISSNYITSICQDQQGNLWFGTQGNFVDRYNLRDKRFYHYSGEKGVLSEYVNGVYSLSDGSVWLASANGLNQFDTKTDSFVAFKHKDGLPSNEVLGVVEAAVDSLWISTAKGLCLYNYRTKSAIVYNVYDGLLSNSINPGAITLASDGYIFLGSPVGLNCFNPRQLSRKSYDYPLLITDFQVFKSDSVTNLVHKDLVKQDELHLSYNENSIAVDFQALTINNAKNMRYAYKLEGLHNNWVYAGNLRRAIFIKLKEGNYIFRLKAYVDDHELGKQVAVAFSVAAPWWRSWWMYIVYCAVLVAILYLLWQFTVLKIKTDNKIALEKKERERLVDIFTAKSNLFTEISHDIRTPLTLVIEPINELLAQYQNKQDKTFKQLERISVNAQRILNLTNQLLEFRRMDAGSIRLQASENDVVAFCSKTVTSFLDVARQRNIQLSVKSSETKIDVWFDTDKLEKVLDNLLANAIKYTPSGGRVELYVSKKFDSEVKSVRRWFKKYIIEHQSEKLEIKVVDTGCGIRAEKLPYIFDRFYNVDENLQTDKMRGHGLGLFIVKHIVELHYGTIEVQSIPNQGSTFTILLPIGREHLTQGEIMVHNQEAVEIIKPLDVPLEKPEPKPVAGFDSKPVVLVVDDEADILEFISETLTTQYHVINCSNGRDAYAMATQTVPDAIVADVMMPFMDGFELCKNIKSDMITCHIPVILLTARNLHESKLKGFESGADAYLTKPFSVRELTVRIEALLDNRSRLTNYFKQTHHLLESSDVVEKITESQIPENVVSDPFIEKANSIIEQYFSDPDFSVVKFAEEMFMSRSQLFRKLKAVADVTPNDYIRTYRLQRAAQILRSHQHLSISEIAYEVGFTSLQYFSSCFQRHFGMTPSEYVRHVNQS